MEQHDTGSVSSSRDNVGAVVVSAEEVKCSGPPVEGDITEPGSQASDAAPAADVTERVPSDPGGVMGDIQKV